MIIHIEILMQFFNNLFVFEKMVEEMIVLMIELENTLEPEIFAESLICNI